MTTAISKQRGSGKGRNSWRIREFLDNQGESLTSVADKARAQLSHTSATLRGVRNHARVLAVLEELGCPRELLYPLEENGRAA